MQNRLSKYTSEYFSTRVVLAIDVFVSLCSSFLVVFLMNFFSMGTIFYSRKLVLYWLMLSLLSAIVAFILSGEYKRVIRHSTLADLNRLVVATAFKEALLCLSFLLLKTGYFRTLALTLILDFLFTFIMMVVVRIMMIIVYKVYKEKIKHSKKSVKVLIYGVSEKSVSLVSRLMGSNHYDVAGFIVQDNNSNVNIKLAGLTTYGFSSDESAREILNATGVDAILYSNEKEAREEKNKLIDISLKEGIKSLIAPSIEELTDKRIESSVRNIKIEDLLGREEIEISIDRIRDNFRGKVILVTGAAGSIGSELCRQLAGLGISKLVLFDNAETPMHNIRLELEESFPDLDFQAVIGDVRQLPRLDFAFREHKPNIVFHAAAYKHVPLMEENPCEAVYVNVVGTSFLAKKCLEYGVDKMIMVSTDKAVNPTNVMGCTKRIAEIYTQSLGIAIASGKHEGKTKFITTRFGNVLGSNGSVIPRFREQIAKGGPITVTHPEINRFFMTIPEACRLVMEAATISEGNQICVFDMGEPVKIDSLARKMIELAGLKPDVDIKIKYTGLRPGEKLYEEVLSDVENTTPTEHKRIRLAKVREYDFAEATVYIDKLYQMAIDVDIIGTVNLMKNMVPEFISNNSRFSYLDKTK